MESRSFHDDEALLAELGEALAEARQPNMERMLADARAAFTFLTMEEELASLVYDSMHEPEAAGARRAPATSRTLVFESGAVSVEMEVTDDGIVGQVVPPSVAGIVIEASDGTRTPLVVDELGCFAAPLPRRGLVRLRVDLTGRATVTDWADLRSPPVVDEQ
jgi:hypothetical protein